MDRVLKPAVPGVAARPRVSTVKRLLLIGLCALANYGLGIAALHGVETVDEAALKAAFTEPSPDT